MANIYDKEKDPVLHKVKEEEGINSGSDSNSGESSNHSFYKPNPGFSASTSSTTSPSSTASSTNSDSEKTSGTSSGNSSNSFYRKSKKSATKSKSPGSSKKKWALLAGGSAAILVMAVIVFVFVSSLLIPNLAQNILTYQFARVSRSFARDNLELNSEKVALDSVATKAGEDSVNSIFKDTTDGLLTKMRSFTPGGVMKNLQTTGDLAFNTEPSRLLQRPILKSITVGDRTIAVTDPSKLKTKFNKLIHPIDSFNAQVVAADEFSTGLNNATRDSVGIIIRSSIEQNIRKRLGISLLAWTVSKYKDKTPSEALDEVNMEAQAKINPASDTTESSVVKGVNDAIEQGDATAKADQSTAAGRAAIIANGGVDANVVAVETSALKNITDNFLSKASLVYAIAVPACIVYDGSLSSTTAGKTIDTQGAELQRSFYYLESAADQQKKGATSPGAVGALNTKLGNIAQSNPEIRASGGTVDTGSSFISPQAGIGGQYSIADTLLPGPLSSLVDQVAVLCPYLTDPRVAVGLVAAQIIATIVLSLPDGGAAAGTEAAGQAAVEASTDNALVAFGKRIADKLASNVVTGPIFKAGGKIRELFTLKEFSKVGAITGLTLLAKMDVVQKTHETYNGYSQGPDLANQSEAGGGLNANEAERQQFYGAPLSNAQVAYNDNSDTQYIATRNKSQGAYQRYLATTNVNSLVSKLSMDVASVFNTSTISKSFSNIVSFLNPVSVSSHLFGSFSGSKASAAESVDSSNYGIVQWGYTSQETALLDNHATAASYQPLENQLILHNSGQEDYLQTVYGNCFSPSTTMGTLLTTKPPDKFTSTTTGTTYTNPDPGQLAYILRSNIGDVTGGLCSETYLGPNSGDLNTHDGSYGNDLVFRWRLAQSYNNTLDQLNGISNAAVTQ